MVSPINDAFMKFEKRAEGADVPKLVETFVDVGPLFTLLGSTDHQIINGRRGTGKTHTLLYLAESRKASNDIAIYVDVRTLGSATSIYDLNESFASRATKLIMDVMSSVHSGILEFAVENAEQHDLSVLGPLLDKLADAISEVRVEGRAEIETKANDLLHSGGEVSAKLGLSDNGPDFGINARLCGEEKSERFVRTLVSGERQFYVHFGSVLNALTRIMQSLKGVKVWLLLDEWSTLPPDLQPYLADMLKRAVFPVRGIVIKVAAIEQRTVLKIDKGRGDYIGIELGADIPGEINLDDFMVFENQPHRARDFFKNLFFKHIKAVDASATSNIVATADQLISEGFTQVNVFDELVQAAEGVPRDAMNIISIAATRALDAKIAKGHIRDAARDWFQRGKERALVSNASAMHLLHYIVDEVIGKKNARAFLLRSNEKDQLIDELFDARVLHILKRNVSGKDQPGVRYDVYKIDYGCYVELLNTNRAPVKLLDIGEEGGDEVQVPQDDYRSIRRAILDLEHFRRAASH